LNQGFEAVGSSSSLISVMKGAVKSSTTYRASTLLSTLSIVNC
jgi:hypothetical protein